MSYQQLAEEPQPQLVGNNVDQGYGVHRQVFPTSNPFGVAEHKLIMANGLFSCFDDINVLCMSCFCAPCVHGSNIQETNGSFLYGCCCFPLCVSCDRSSLQMILGVPDQGCLSNFFTSYFCSICALTQETRAVKSWASIGKPPPFPTQMRMGMNSSV